MDPAGEGPASDRGTEAFDRERFNLLYVLVDAWWKADPREEFEARRIGDDREAFFHPGLPGLQLAASWPHLRALEADGYLEIDAKSGPKGSTWVRLKQPARALFDAVNAPPEPAAATRRIGFEVPGDRAD